MAFVCIHIVWFGSWIAFGFERYPYGLLTMIVSLEAIFLSTFVMISQNRADGRRALLAAQEYQSVQLEEKLNEELLVLSKQILDLTTAIQQMTANQSPARRRTPRARSSASAYGVEGCADTGRELAEFVRVDHQRR